MIPDVGRGHRVVVKSTKTFTFSCTFPVNLDAVIPAGNVTKLVFADVGSGFCVERERLNTFLIERELPQQLTALSAQ